MVPRVELCNGLIRVGDDGWLMSGRRLAATSSRVVVQRFLYGEETTQAQILRPSAD